MIAIKGYELLTNRKIASDSGWLIAVSAHRDATTCGKAVYNDSTDTKIVGQTSAHIALQTGTVAVPEPTSILLFEAVLVVTGKLLAQRCRITVQHQFPTQNTSAINRLRNPERILGMWQRAPRQRERKDTSSEKTR